MIRPCNRCGECCLKYGSSIVADSEDIVRWTNEKRWDILEHVDLLNWREGQQGDIYPTETTSRCPFLRKDNGKPTYKCRIHDTKPKMCRDYEPWIEGAVCKEIE
jgi:Fe-S-cluster containining protein